MPASTLPIPAPLQGQRDVPVPGPGHASRIRRLQDLVGRVDGMPDPDSRALVEQLLHAVMQLHGAGLTQVLELAREKGPQGGAAFDAFINDPTLRSLLIIHDLHPLSLEERMQQALAKVLPYIKSHGGDVQVLGIVDGTVRLRLKGTCKTCPSSTITLDLAVRAAFEEYCPDLVGFEVIPPEPDAAPAAPPPEGLVCLGAAAIS